MSSRTASLLGWLACLVTITGSAFAAPPSSLSGLVTRVSLTDAQKDDIKAYADHYLGLLQNGGVEDVMRARAKLIDPMSNVMSGSSSLFRSTYAADLLPALEIIIDMDDAYRSINALQVAGFLGTESAVNILVERTESASEPAAEKRLWAVIALREAISRGDLTSRKISSAARNLARASEDENDWKVLAREFEVISSIARSTMAKDQGGEELRALGRRLQLQMVTSSIDRLVQENSDSPVELIHALRPSILDIRQQYIDPQLMDHRREVGLGVAPQLGRVYDVILVHFDGLREDPDLQRVSGLTLRLSEETLKLIDSDLRSGAAVSVDSSGPWAEGQQATIRDNRNAWSEILGGSPYDGR